MCTHVVVYVRMAHACVLCTVTYGDCLEYKVIYLSFYLLP